MEIVYYGTTARTDLLFKTELPIVWIKTCRSDIKSVPTNLMDTIVPILQIML